MAPASFLCGTFLLLLLCSFLPGSLSVSYTVGDSSGWTIPSESSLNYDRWASSHTFHIGDSLVFNYAPQSHSVLQVTHSSYRACNLTSPFSLSSDGKTLINLAHKGSYYFICGVPGHCQAGQKFQLKVVDVGGHVETSQAAAARGNAAMLAPAPAPINGAVPPATASAPSLQNAKMIMMMMLMSFVTFTLTAYTHVHALA